LKKEKIKSLKLDENDLISEGHSDSESSNEDFEDKEIIFI